MLGSGHFNNPGRDVSNVRIDEVLTSVWQAQMAAAGQLAAFQTLSISTCAIQAYRHGAYTVRRGERDQLGLRVAPCDRLGRSPAR